MPLPIVVESRLDYQKFCIYPPLRSYSEILIYDVILAPCDVISGTFRNFCFLTTVMSFFCPNFLKFDIEISEKKIFFRCLQTKTLQSFEITGCRDELLFLSTRPTSKLRFSTTATCFRTRCFPTCL